MWRLQGFDSEAFVRQHWQKAPCVIRGAFADFESPITPGELAGLACEDGVHARLVLEHGGEHPWQVRYGPFAEAELEALPEGGYSLLVSECEKWLPELRAMLEQFRFVPDWRIDDLMISYAPPGGSVGPHVDEYDVFLLQAEGRRRWHYDSDPCPAPRLIDGPDLAILEHFHAQHEIVLEPGDLLYLPPGRAHHGVALDACMTWSIGMRAPDALAVLDSLALEADRRDAPPPRYRDPDLETDRHPAAITEREIERFRELVVDWLGDAPDLWRDAVGRMLSDASPGPAAEDPPPLISDLLRGPWIRHPDTRMLFHESADAIRLYCNGDVYPLPRDEATRERIGTLCREQEWPRSLVSECVGHEALARCLMALAANGAIVPDED